MLLAEAGSSPFASGNECMVGTWRLLSKPGGRRLSWATSKTERTSSLAFWSVPWGYICSDLCARLGLAKGEQCSQCFSGAKVAWSLILRFGLGSVSFCLCFVFMNQLVLPDVHIHGLWSCKVKFIDSPSLRCPLVGVGYYFCMHSVLHRGKLFS